MEDVNEIVFSHNNFGDNIWDSVMQQLELLCQGNYIAIISEYDDNSIVIQYSYQKEEYGCPLPDWLTPEERELIRDFRGNKGRENQAVEALKRAKEMLNNEELMVFENVDTVIDQLIKEYGERKYA